MNFSFWLDKKEFKLNLNEKSKNHVLISLDGKEFLVLYAFINDDELLLNIEGKIYNALIDANSSVYSICVNGNSYKIEKKTTSQILRGRNEKQGRKDITTSMPGRIVKILAQEGEDVKEGQPILILEAMKMQNEIKSPQPGKIIQIKPRENESVEAGALLFTVS